MKFLSQTAANTRLWLTPSLFTMILLTLTGCSDLAGEKPKIESADKKETPAAPAVDNSTSAPATGANTTASGWDTFADNGFATSATAAADGANSATVSADTSLSTGGTAAIATTPEVSLAEAPMLYLRRGAEAKVAWKPWGGSAFQEAASRNLPMLIVIGTGWNHFSRALDVNTFGNDAVAQAINSGFVAIRVDADERPDVASRYRLAYEVINKKLPQMPLVVFAMADGRPFDVVSYDALQGGGQEPPLLPLLNQSVTLLANQRADVEKQCASVEDVLKTIMSEPKAGTSESPDKAVSDYSKALVAATKGEAADALRGGLVAESLLSIAAGGDGSGNQDAGSELMLSRFRSAQRDHVLGGYFYRVPEAAVEYGKLLTVQADYLAANSDAYGLTGKSLHKEAGGEVLRFCRDWLEAPEGGFFTAHTPDFADDDNGGYFTWSKEEIASNAGEGDDAKVFAAYLNAKSGDKQPLYVSGKLQQAADAVGVSYEVANKALATVRTKLTEARMAAEKIPSVDKSVLANWNGQAISAYLDAAKYLGDDKAKEFALKSADRIIGTMISEKDGVGHVLYKDQVSGYGLLDDNVKLASALVDCYRATSEKEYLDSAISLMTYVEASFLDADTGLYFDRIAGKDELGLLKLRRMPLDDDVTRSANAVAAITWIKLAAAASNDDYKSRAERLINAAVERRSFNAQSVSTWAEAASMLKNGVPEFKK